MRLIFKDFPLSSHRLARGAHEAARCAGAMGKYWPYHDRLFAEQPRFERHALIQYAGDLGLDRADFTRCVDERRFAAAVDKDVKEGRAIGVSATPTFIINDQPFVGAHQIDSFRTIIEGALRENH